MPVRLAGDVGRGAMESPRRMAGGVIVRGSRGGYLVRRAPKSTNSENAISMAANSFMRIVLARCR